MGMLKSSWISKPEVQCEIWARNIKLGGGQYVDGWTHHGVNVDREEEGAEV